MKGALVAAALGAALAAFLHFVMDAPMWFIFIAAVALGVAVGAGEVASQRKAEPKPTCARCRRGDHLHADNGTCVFTDCGCTEVKA